MARELEYQRSAFDAVLLRLTKYALGQIDAFFEQSKRSLKFEKKTLEKIAAKSEGEGDCDDQWVDEVAKLERFAWLSSEFAIIGLWRCVELYRRDAIEHALGSDAVQGLFNHKEFQKKLRSLWIEETQICCAEHVDELRCLNNAIKHERQVRGELTKFPRWEAKKGDELGDLEHHYSRLRPLTEQYLEDLAKRLKAKFPPPHLDQEMNAAQVAWRQHHVETSEQGWQNGKQRPWILPAPRWEDGLWPGIRSGSQNPLQSYLDTAGVQKHPGVHNLKSSWVLCANLYFAHRQGMEILGRFLAERIDRRIIGIERLELEYAEKCPLDPTTLLGEPQGKRGANQTSPDIAFIVTLKTGGRGLILTENKFTEHSFYPCSGRKKKYGNPDRERCLNAKAVIENPAAQCHLLDWETDRRKNRKYWQYLTISRSGRRTLRSCPAATAGYQLFRQQALAEAIAQSGAYDLVVSAVAYDARNKSLIRSMKNAGIGNFSTDWAALFKGRTRFASFTHQDWVQWVRTHDANGQWADWLSWVAERYGY